MQKLFYFRRLNTSVCTLHAYYKRWVLEWNIWGYVMYNSLTFENPTDRILTGFMRTDGWRDMTRLLVAFRNFFKCV